MFLFAVNVCNPSGGILKS